MKNPITTFNGYLLGKIENYLKTREGCKTMDFHYTLDGCKLIVQDSFGYRYEVDVKTIGRTHDYVRNCAND